ARLVEEGGGQGPNEAGANRWRRPRCPGGHLGPGGRRVSRACAGPAAFLDGRLGVGPGGPWRRSGPAAVRAPVLAGGRGSSGAVPTRGKRLRIRAKPGRSVSRLGRRARPSTRTGRTDLRRPLVRNRGGAGGHAAVPEAARLAAPPTTEPDW